MKNILLISISMYSIHIRIVKQSREGRDLGRRSGAAQRSDRVRRRLFIEFGSIPKGSNYKCSGVVERLRNTKGPCDLAHFFMVHSFGAIIQLKYQSSLWTYSSLWRSLKQWFSLAPSASIPLRHDVVSILSLSIPREQKYLVDKKEFITQCRAILIIYSDILRSENKFSRNSKSHKKFSIWTRYRYPRRITIGM